VRIEDATLEERSGRYRLSATLAWEDVGRPPERLWFEVRPGDAAFLTDAWEPFVVAAYPLALASGEDRVAVEGSLCPRLCDDLPSFGRVLAGAGDAQPPTLDPGAGCVAPRPSDGGSVACFLSGGVDSLAMLRANHREYPRDHPGRITAGVTLFGLNSFDFDGGRPVAEREDAFRRYLGRLEALGEGMGVRVVPVRTNVRHLYPDFATWARVGGAAGTIAGGMVLAAGVRTLWFASHGNLPDPRPTIAHQFHVHLLSNAALEVHLGQGGVGRFRKTAVVADWPEGRRILRSCTGYRLPEPGKINCGSCEKCVRTMLALVALGKLHLVDAYERDDLGPEDLAVLEDEAPLWGPEHYAECLEPLRAAGRDDLARAVEGVLARLRRARREGAPSGVGRLADLLPWGRG
jgi:hypothetical protein